MENAGNTELNYCYNCMTRMASGQRICPVCGHDNSIRRNSDNALPEGKILCGKYLVGKTLGQGGFGITYLGYNLIFQMKVAIKEYFPTGLSYRNTNTGRVNCSTTDSGSLEKGMVAFRQEAFTLHNINSPHVVRVLDYFQENNTGYIVMEYVEGCSLTEEAVKCGGRIAWERVLTLFKPLIPELQKIHEQHLIHRDIKPDNIKLTKDSSGKEKLMLLDFGSARSFISACVTKTYTAMVTPGYAPLEQYSYKSRQGPFTDVYSLCATMYALITGILPASATDRMEGEAEVLPIRKTGIPIPEQADNAIMHGMAVRKNDRPQTMAELYLELYGQPKAYTVPAAKAVPGPAQDTTVVRQAENPVSIQKGTEPAVSRRPEKLPEKGAVPAVLQKRSLKILWLLPLIAVFAAAGILFVRSRMVTEPAVTETVQPTEPLVIRALTNTPTKTAEPTATLTPTVKPTETAVPKPAVKAGDIIKLGSYEQDANTANGAEAIEWQVLAAEGGRALLISRYGLDSVTYHEKDTDITWETCTLRKWLNETFLQAAFTPDEQKNIAQVWNVNLPNTEYDIPGGNATSDRIFLLSIDELGKYLPAPEDKYCKPTDYARQRGVWVNNKGLAWWWLRSPGFESRHAAFVDALGFLEPVGWVVDYLEGAVRPVMWINL